MNRTGITIGAIALAAGLSIAALVGADADAQSRQVTVDVADITVQNLTLWPLPDGGCLYEVHASHPEVAIQPQQREKGGATCAGILTMAAKAAARDAKLDAGAP